MAGLTSEERSRIYIEEKARIETLQRIIRDSKRKRIFGPVGIFLGFIILSFVFYTPKRSEPPDTLSASSSMPSESTHYASPPVSPKEAALNSIVLNFSWKKDGFDTIMTANFIIHNKSKYDVKDIEITCSHFAKSGTRIDRNRRTLYEIVKANEKRTFEDFDMGFIHSQVNTSSCGITDLVVM